MRKAIALAFLAASAFGEVCVLGSFKKAGGALCDQGRPDPACRDQPDPPKLGLKTKLIVKRTDKE